MANSWNGWCWQLGLASFIGMGGTIAISGDCVRAQITPDGTLGAESSVVTPTNVDGLPTNQIDGGATRGANLFHSFEQFSVPTGSAAHFNNAANIQNIFSRVTGSSISNIDGLLRANGTTNLFLLNPNGIIFGPNASLNIGGSILGSTASSLNFADGTQFSATAPQTTPLLTVSVPIGLQYGANPGRILVQGNGQGTRTTTDLIDTTFGLRVQPDQTLAMVGGDVSLSGGTLKTAGGRIELGSVAGPSLVSLSSTENGFSLGYEVVPTFGDIQLSGAAAVDASGAGGGDIQIRGRRLTLTNGSQIEASTLGSEPGGTLAVNVSESVELIGTSADGQFGSGLFAQTEGDGDAGDLTIATGRLLVRDGARVLASTFDTGDGGTLSVTVSRAVELIGTSADGQVSSGLFAQTQGDGDAGDLTITTGRLLVRNGAQVAVSTFDTGDGGTLSVTASDTVEVIGTSANGQPVSGLFAQVVPRAEGDAGDLTIATGRLLVRDGAQVSAGTFGTGAGGTLSVTAADAVEVIGRSADGQFGSKLSAQTEGDGDAGDLTIATRRLLVRDGAQVSASTFDIGDGGTLSVSASDAIEVIGTSADGQSPSGLSAQTEGDGDAGDLRIATGRLLVRDGAQVGAGTLSTGAGGTLSITAADAVEVIGESADGQIGSGLFVRAEGDGDAGDLTIATGRLLVRDGAQVSAGTPGTGAGGTLSVTAADAVEVIGRSADGQFPSGLFVQTEGAGDAGDLTIATGRLLVRDGAQVSASTFGTGTGGTLSVSASDAIEVIGTSADGQSPSGLFARTRGGGDAGDLRIATGRLTVRDGALVTVSSTGSANAGNLEVEADSIGLDNRATLSADTTAGQGNIILGSQDLVLRRGSNITTNAQGTATGGNITLNTDILAALENSDISANALEGPGGRIIINARGIFGTEFSNKPTPESDITASSDLGPEFSGVVEINTPGIDPSIGLATLPAELVEASGLIATSCAAVGENEFIVTGRGGIPSNPSDTLSSDTVWTDLRYRTKLVENQPSSESATQPTNSTPNQLVEAQGWLINNFGEVVLTAHAPNVTPHSPGLTPTTCHTP